MDSPGANGRRRGTTKVSAEDQALDQIAKEVCKRCVRHDCSINFFPMHFVELDRVFLSIN